MTDEERELASSAKVVINKPSLAPADQIIDAGPSTAAAPGEPDQAEEPQTQTQTQTQLSELTPFRAFSVCVIAFAIWPQLLLTQVALGACGIWLFARAGSMRD